MFRLAPNPQLPGVTCDYSGAPYCCCQDLRLAQESNPRRKPAVRFRGDMALKKELAKRFPELRRKAAARGIVLNDSFPGTGKIRLLGDSSKVDKGIKKGVVTAILYLSPSTESGINLCPYASEECAAACLGHAAGQLSMSSSRNARAWKTILYLTDRPLFMKLISSEISDLQKKVKKKYRGRKITAVRLDGATDLGMARLLVRKHPDIQFYDYTKDYPRMLQYLRGELPPNWHLTFSYSGRNLEEALQVLRFGGNVAVVFDADPRLCDPIPAFWNRFPVLDADADDIRFWDPPGHVAGLRFKQARRRLLALEEAGPFVGRPSPRRKLLPRLEKNPPVQLRRQIESKRTELDDARYFRAPLDDVERLEQELAAIEERLAGETEAFEASVRRGLERTQREAEHEAWRRGYKRNPFLATGSNPRDPVWDELERAERELEEAGRRRRHQVAGAGSRGRVKTRSKKRAKKVRKNRTSKGKKKPKAKTKRYTIAEARERFDGVDEAVRAYRRFHGKNPSHVDVYELDDGSDEVTVERAHAALHRTIDTNYFVPWESSKKNTLWKHEHVEGYDLSKTHKAIPPAENFPLEILDPATGTTRKIAGKFCVGDWWID